MSFGVAMKKANSEEEFDHIKRLKNLLGKSDNDLAADFQAIVTVMLDRGADTGSLVTLFSGVVAAARANLAMMRAVLKPGKPE